MSIQYTAQVQDDLLIVKTSGYDESLAEVEEYGIAVIQAAIVGGVSRVLCDERELEYRLNTILTFESARFIADHAPKVGRVAIVCKQEMLKNGQFWETVAVNRGLKVTVTSDYDKAYQWLTERAVEAKTKSGAKP